MTDSDSDERELTQLVKDLNDAVVKADIAVLERRSCTRTTSITMGTARSRTGEECLGNGEDLSVEFESLVPSEWSCACLRRHRR